MKLKLKPIWRGYKYPLKYPSNWIDIITQIPQTITAFIQRGRYGVSSRDCWNLDGYVLDVMKNGLQIFKNDTNGYPGFLTEKEWDNVLDRMIELIDVVATDPIDSPEATFVWERGMNEDMKWERVEYKERWLENVKRATKYRQECLDELCDLMKEYFDHLWW